MRPLTWLACAALSPLLPAQGFPSDLFDSPIPAAGPWPTHEFHVADVTGDGRPDLVAPYFGLWNSVLVPATEDGFEPGIIFVMGQAMPFEALEVADVDVDGLSDVLVSQVGALIVRRSLGAGVLGNQQVSDLPLTNTPFFDVLAADMQGDGLPDLVAACYLNQETWHIFGAKGKGDGTFGSFGLLLDSRYVLGLAEADVDVDGDLDLLQLAAVDGAATPAALLTLVNDGSGALEPLSPGEPLTADVQLDTPRDHDLDGIPDALVFDTTQGVLTQLIGLGNGHFVAHELLDVGHPVDDAVAADLDRDGFVDVAVVLRDDEVATDAPVLVQRIVRDQPAGDPIALAPPGPNHWLKAADFDLDGLLDLAVSAPVDGGDGVLVHGNGLGPVADLGHASPGGPLLSATGELLAGEVVTLDFGVTGPPGPALLVTGVQAAPQPFLGALVVPQPLVVVGLVAPATLSATWPSGVPMGTLVYLQGFVAAGDGVAGSNVLLLVPQP